MAFGWDVDDDIFDEDEEEEDNSHPFGEDEDPNKEEPVKDEDEAGGEENKPEKEEKPKEDKQQEQQAKMQVKKKPDPWDPKVTIPLAKSVGIVPPVPLPIPCPHCKKMSLFMDKWFSNGARIAILIAWAAAVKAVNAEDITKMPHFLCLNKKCKHFFKKGWWYELGPTKKLEARFNIFHIDR